MTTFTIHKLDHRGKEKLAYTGKLLERGSNFVCIQATFSLPTMTLDYVTLKQGDLFTEWFYSDRWYNVFRIQDVDTNQLKGFYCNLTRPAHITQNAVYAEDLALDIFVKPDATMLKLDEDEYDALDLTSDEHREVQSAISAIQQLVQRRQMPFDEL